MELVYNRDGDLVETRDEVADVELMERPLHCGTERSNTNEQKKMSKSCKDFAISGQPGLHKDRIA